MLPRPSQSGSWRWPWRETPRGCGRSLRSPARARRQGRGWRRTGTPSPTRLRFLSILSPSAIVELVDRCRYEQGVYDRHFLWNLGKRFVFHKEDGAFSFCVDLCPDDPRPLWDSFGYLVVPWLVARREHRSKQSKGDVNSLDAARLDLLLADQERSKAPECHAHSPSHTGGLSCARGFSPQTPKRLRSVRFSSKNAA